MLGAVTLSNLLATWAAHDLTHLHQVSRVMAWQYRDEVGPFGAFLGVMKCQGTGDDAGVRQKSKRSDDLDRAFPPKLRLDGAPWHCGALELYEDFSTARSAKADHFASG